MDRIIYTAMNGAKQTFDQQSVASHNLANVSTPGFRAQLAVMQSVPVDGDGLKTRELPLASTIGSDFKTGPIMTTDRTLDVALKGDGWIAVQQPDGTEAYTRRGDMQMDSNGQLTILGNPVLGENGPISIPVDSQISIGANGSISVIQAGQRPDTISAVDRIKVVKADGVRLERQGNGLFLPPEGEQVRTLTPDDDAQMVSGALEGSNMSPTEAMVAMIDTQRRYEMQMKVISSADSNDQAANKLLSMT
ncbi:flagellar basal-body rod protein FlgF [Pseudomonas putida]|uniref:Flagellar basal-body rod protein FlgF n=1 Tax=Pseudomonas putida TaxID=303 RepID=A0A8I1EAU6_PSEPU|nr:flagellar basal-body rod protein FlgF [Pseudomonas putida]MBI6882567.1 flagellar basal-body rod protein FlgF [Pseudomonas putida]